MSSRTARRLGLACAAAGAAALAAPAALADQTITAAPINQYANGDITIDQGEHVSFNNTDANTHTVTADRDGPDGKPLFDTGLTNPNQTDDVAGTQYLTTGRYAYTCSVHSFMKGSITVTANGTPVPRPGGGGSGDTTAPRVRVAFGVARRAAVTRSRTIPLTLTINEAGRVTLTATTRSGRRNVTLGRVSVSFSGARTRSVSLHLGRTPVRRLRHISHPVVSIAARAVDSAGNARTVHVSRRLR